MWYKFNSIEEFDAWHTAIKNQLGIPLPDGISIAYTDLLTRDNGELFAWVDEQYAQGLTPTDAPADKPRT